MDPAAMKPFGLALLDFWKGDKSTRFTLIRDDGFAEELPISDFFRGPGEFTGLENRALDLCRGHVLDVGAGAGHHSLVLQRRGLEVCAIDISPEAVHVMREEGVADVRESDVLQFDGGRFDTILMLGHGIGMAEDIDGLRRLLSHLGVLLRPGGQVLADFVDPRATSEPRHLAYHEANRNVGRYFGETRLRLRFKGQTGPTYGWLLVDPGTLAREASASGWITEILQQEADGTCLARFMRAGE
jgi:SAM-dependent methyltransferase